MKTMTITDFKSHALRVIDRVACLHENVVILKRGKPVADLVPHASPVKELKPGMLASTLVFQHDIVSPIDADAWEATK
jgi:antitoxin (DNA-binding transcriptional repressor) of toxin-antitoxin stability system